MNYWHMQLHPNNSNWGRERELLEKFSIIGLGDWKEGINQQPDFVEKMQIGDIVAIKCGGSLIALVEVTGEYEYKKKEETGDLDWFERRRTVKVLDWYKEEYNLYISPRATLKRCEKESDARSTNSIMTWYKNYLGKYSMETKINKLRSNLNTILYGPPGTGKTFNTLNRALQIIGEDEERKIDFENRESVKSQFDKRVKEE
jgi:5-methylcytosine-specific restriction protein B